jgi:pterin-4a-carbinolamine dehydratase
MQTGIQHSQAVSCQGYHILGQKTVHHPEWLKSWTTVQCPLSNDANW